MSAERPAQLAARTFHQLHQYASSPHNSAYYYEALAVSSLVLAKTNACGVSG